MMSVVGYKLNPFKCIMVCYTIILKSGNQQIQSDWVYIYTVAIAAFAGLPQRILGRFGLSLVGLTAPSWVCFTIDIMCGVDGGITLRHG